MGWTGTYMGSCPKGAERVALAVHQEGYAFSEGYGNEWRKSEVAESALVGSTVYLAVRYTDSKGQDFIYAAVILTAYKNGEFFTKGMSENALPYYCDCPKRILDNLSEPATENARTWRKSCEEVRKEKSGDQLLKVPFGGKVRRKDTGAVLVAYKYGKRKVFVDWMTNRYLTPANLRRVGYEIIKEGSEK